MKKSHILIISLLLVFCMLFSLVACRVDENDEKTATYSYIGIDINPSLELVVDESNVVVSVNALNEDALVLISGEEIEGLTLDEASELIVSLASELGYLNEENTDVNFTVVADNEEISAELEVKLEQGAKRGCDLAEIKFKAREELDKLINEAKEKYPELKEESLNAGKLHLIYAIQKYNAEFTVEQGLELEIRDLARMLCELKRQNDEKTPEAVKEAFEKHFKEVKDEARRKIAGVYGDDFLEKWESNEELRAKYEELKAEYEAIYISSEDALAIEELLEIDLSEVKEEDGSIKLCVLNEKIKDELKECASNIRAEVMAILRSYEEEFLSGDAFKDAMQGFEDKFKKPEGENEDATTEGGDETEEAEKDFSEEFESFEDFKDFVKDEGEKIKREKGDIELNEGQREQIEGFRNEMKDKFGELDGELGDFLDKIEGLFPNKK